MIYFFYGEDTFTLAQKLRELKNEFLSQNPQAAVEEIVFNAEFADEEFAKLLALQFENQGLFASQKFLTFRNFLSGIAKLPKTEKYLIEKLAQTEGIDVVFAQDEKFDKRLKFFKKLQSLAKTREFVIPTGEAFKAWIQERLKTEDFKIAKDALEKLLDAFGEEYTLWQASTELEKLMLRHLGKPQTERLITAWDIEDLVSPNVTQNVFALTNLVAERRTSQAVRLLEQMVSSVAATDAKSQIIQIVGALAQQTRSLLLAKSQEKKPPAEIAKALGWKEGRVWINLKLAKKFEETKLVQLLRDLKAIDYRLKTSEESPKLLLALFFQKAAT